MLFQLIQLLGIKYLAFPRILNHYFYIVVGRRISKLMADLSRSLRIWKRCNVYLLFLLRRDQQTCAAHSVSLSPGRGRNPLPFVSGERELLLFLFLVLFCFRFFCRPGGGRPAKESRRQVDGHGEYDGRVVLGRDAVQRLEIAELQQRM